MRRLAYKLAVAITSSALAYMGIIGFVLVGESETGRPVVTGFELRGLLPFLGTVVAFVGVMRRDQPLVWMGAVLATLFSILLVFSIGIALFPAALALILAAVLTRYAANAE